MSDKRDLSPEEKKNLIAQLHRRLQKNDSQDLSGDETLGPSSLSTIPSLKVPENKKELHTNTGDKIEKGEGEKLLAGLRDSQVRDKQTSSDAQAIQSTMIHDVVERAKETNVHSAVQKKLRISKKDIERKRQDNETGQIAGSDSERLSESKDEYMKWMAKKYQE